MLYTRYEVFLDIFMDRFKNGLLECMHYASSLHKVLLNLIVAQAVWFEDNFYFFEIALADSKYPFCLGRPCM